MKNMVLYEQIIQIINEETDSLVLRERLHEFHPYDLAEVFSNLNEEDRQKIYQALSDQEIADIFSYLEEEETVTYLKDLAQNQGASIIDKMEIDDAVDIIKEMDDPTQTKEFLSFLSPETRDEIEYLTKYSEDSVGSIMTTNYIAIESNYDVKEAMKALIHNANESEVIDPLYVVQAGSLIGTLDLTSLIIARSPNKIQDIMKPNPIYVEVEDDVTVAISKLRDYGLSALPVVEGYQMVGIVTLDDAIDVVSDDVNYHYSNLAGVRIEDEDKGNLFQQLLKRFPWLVILLLLSILTSNVLNAFEDIIKQVTILIFFQTLILDMAGNVGTQSLAVTIRILSSNELDNRQNIRKHILKEIRINTINSFILTIMAFLVCFIFLTLRYSEQNNIILISLIVAVSMGITLIITGILGSFIPILFNRINIDPAVASGPLITTLNDIISVIIYFSIASLFLHLLI